MEFDKILINNIESRSLNGSDFVVLSVRCPIYADDDLVFRINGTTLDWHPIHRPDLPRNISWFAVYLDLPSLALALSNELVLSRGLETIARVQLTLSASEIARLKKVREQIDGKRHRLKDLTRDGTWSNGKVSAIDAARHDPALKLKSDKVSTHPYAEAFTAMMAGLPNDALVLDVGAGFRFKHHPNIVTLEIFDYPSTDVISFGDTMPFKSASFDMVYTNAVLEHVDNPFAVADEIARVLKPGGKLYSSIPFLQVEHGYPFHYFNATRMGHRRLFENSFTIEDISVGRAGHPWHIIMRSLGLLRSGLPKDLREEFEKLTVGEILNGTYKDWVSSPYGTCNDEIMWRLAGSTVLIGERKPS
ncbi:MAG: class I SAM-dependent methyltransferase [Mesorhizobium sp.]|nr:class I SAM-dependent methyltransferase [Mesorhizobium sp.]